MTLIYQATLDDFAEPAIRHYLRSKTARHARLRSTVSGAVLTASTLVFVLRDRSWVFLVGGAAAGVVIGAAINFWTYLPNVKKRIRKHLQTEHGHRIPDETIYTVEPGVLRCESLGVKYEFPLRELKEVLEDAGYIELSFGELGLCTLPIRAFSDPSEKAAFLAEVEVSAGRLAAAGKGSI